MLQAPTHSNSPHSPSGSPGPQRLGPSSPSVPLPTSRWSGFARAGQPTGTCVTPPGCCGSHECTRVAETHVCAAGRVRPPTDRRPWRHTTRPAPDPRWGHFPAEPVTRFLRREPGSEAPRGGGAVLGCAGPLWASTLCRCQRRREGEEGRRQLLPPGGSGISAQRNPVVMSLAFRDSGHSPRLRVRAAAVHHGPRRTPGQTELLAWAPLRPTALLWDGRHAITQLRCHLNKLITL